MMLFGHPNANTNVREAALALLEQDLLAEFHTGLDTTALVDRAPARLRGELARRAFDTRLSARIRTHAGPEVVRLALERQRLLRYDSHGGRWSIQRRFEAIDGAVARRLDAVAGLLGVYMYEDGAAASFAAARERGLTRLYDLPIGYWRASVRILGEEAELQPAWASTMQALADPPEKLERKDTEIALASRVVVASAFTRSTLAEVPGAESLDVTVVPYGVPEPWMGPREASRGPLRVLYVGGLSQRKGISYLFDAMRALGAAATLTVIGRPADRENRALRDALAGTTWIESLPNAVILEQMRQHDVVVLPSLFEGFGLVLAEAMSQGTPFIATDHTGGPELVGDASGDAAPGWIVPIRSVDAIADRLQRLADSPEARAASSAAALARAAELPWSVHRASLGRFARDSLATV
ncbi:glycosyltransferase family 4 protein [Demequina rhizosphaerae]|uniref:glycosyltransferase family 4 protein n=1 Tax=Demequina rhizosphaerae TaxID=1638985 RepID=UPI0007846107|nr:glycosyltransferase family 4 protein [Demequina rhizosphaerae]